MAISIVNAQMYNNLEGIVQERTEELESSNEELEATNEELSSTVDELNRQSLQKEEALKELRISEKKLIESNAAKDRFFSIIAHDLKGPIGSISNILRSLEDGEITLNEQLLSSMAKSSSHVFDLLEDLLIWARSQNKTLKANPIIIDLNILIPSVLSTFELQARKKDIEITYTEVEDSCGVFADKSIINTVLRNLISNAIKFSPQGSQINIYTKSDQNFY